MKGGEALDPAPPPLTPSERPSKFTLRCVTDRLVLGPGFSLSPAGAVAANLLLQDSVSVPTPGLVFCSLMTFGINVHRQRLRVTWVAHRQCVENKPVLLFLYAFPRNAFQRLLRFPYLVRVCFAHCLGVLFLIYLEIWKKDALG